MKKVLAFALSLCLLLSGVALAETGSETESSYTYNYSLPTFPTNWNPHQYKTASDNDDMLRWLSDGFFEFDYNENEDGYTMVPSMVVGEPEDVTADYVGEEWGIEEGAEGRAWKYTLREGLMWEDGTPINAQSFVTSPRRRTTAPTACTAAACACITPKPMPSRASRRILPCAPTWRSTAPRTWLL